jgi:hypothetical protein
VRRLAAVLGAAVLLAACSPTNTTPQPTAIVKPTPVVTLGPSETPVPTSGVVIDSRLLDVLPVTVEGLAVSENPEGETSALGDPQLALVGSSIAAGLAVDQASGDFVYAVVVRLLPGAMDDGVFRDWRDSYDEGACSQASGVAGNAEAQIDGRTVYIGTCTGGVRTYHVWLEPQETLISASAVGNRRFGELLMQNLRVP